MKKELVCEHCGKKFLRYPSQIVGKHQLCSRECHDLFRLKCIYECEVCGKIFHRPVRLNQKTPRFCSRKCMHIQLSKERNPINCECRQCKKKFHKSSSAIKSGEGKFCSLMCRNTYMTGKGKHGVGLALYPHYYNRPDWKKLRLEILKRDNFTCQHCGVKPIKTSGLQVHHKDRRLLGGLDKSDNLITLCFSCHKKADGRLY